MDASFIHHLEQAGLPVEPIELSVDPNVGPRVLVISSAGHVQVEPKPITQLFSGDRQPPSLAGEPPAEYLPFFLTLERCAALACELRGRPETDEEFDRIYRLLRRRPDGADKNPIFGAIQQAARVYMSLVDVSQAEYEAVMNRLAKSARTFRMHVGSTNYYKYALSPMLGS